MTETKGKTKTLTGTVISHKMDKTISVRIQRTVKHPMYGKYLLRSTKMLAHDENNECNPGDIVIIEPTKPISKNKSWTLQRIVSKTQEI